MIASYHFTDSDIYKVDSCIFQQQSKNTSAIKTDKGNS